MCGYFAARSALKIAFGQRTLPLAAPPLALHPAAAAGRLLPSAG